MRYLLHIVFSTSLLVSLNGSSTLHAQELEKYFKIVVLDKETGRGLPLVELKTTNNRRYYTDSNGIIAFDDPVLLGQPLFFWVKSHGYGFPKKTFNEIGTILNTSPGESVILKMRRINIAERLYRITGQDIYGESALVGHPIPLKHPRLNGKVVGQDTYLEVLYHGKLYWFWGDTYGPARFNGSVSGATSELPGEGGLDPSVGIDFTYFVDSSGFSKPMCPLSGSGLVWLDWVITLPDEKGNERLYAKYSRMKNLGVAYERGLAVFNDSAQVFKRIKPINKWLDQGHSSGHPVLVNLDDFKYFYFTDGFQFIRVQADIRHVLNPKSYESFTCLLPGTKYDKATSNVERNANGKLIYSWKIDTDPINREREQQLVISGKITSEEKWWQVRNIVSGQTIPARPGSVFWNDFRKHWVMIAQGDIGDVWYLEGDTPTGPWVYGRKIVSHNRYNFYNVGQHPIFDQEGGRLIYFEGTYTTSFSDNNDETPLYNYNQIMYRLSLDDSRLSLPAPVYRIKDSGGRVHYQLRNSVDAYNLWEKIEEVAFFAISPDRKYEGLVAVYSTIDSLSGCDKFALHAYPGRRSNVTGRPLFFALPSENGKEYESSDIVPLFEYCDKNGLCFYSTDLDFSGTKRSPKPICFVWQNVSSVLALDYNVKPVRFNR